MGSSSFGASVGVGVAVGATVGVAVGVAGSGVGKSVADGLAGSACSVGDSGTASFCVPAGVLPQAVQERASAAISNSVIIFVLFMIISLLYQNSVTF